jgi:hypothetical protein
MSEMTTGLDLYTLGSLKKVTNSEDRKSLYRICLAQTKQARFVMCLGLSAIRRLELFREEGYENFGDFARGALEMSPTTAHRHAMIGDGYTLLIEEEMAKGGGNVELLMGALHRLSQHEGQAVARLTEDQQRELSKKLVFVDEAGNEYDQDELQDRFTKNLTEVKRELEANLRRANTQMEEKDVEIAELKKTQNTATQGMLEAWDKDKRLLNQYEGERKEGEAFEQEMKEVEEYFTEALRTIEKYGPRTVEQYAKMPIQCDGAAALARKYIGRLKSFCDKLEAIERQAEGD